MTRDSPWAVMVHSPNTALTNSAVMGSRRPIRLTATAHGPALTALMRATQRLKTCPRANALRNKIQSQ